MSEPTPSLHERLCKAALTAYFKRNQGVFDYIGVNPSALADIEQAIREDATATLRAEVEMLEDGCDRWRADYNALKARADALLEAAVGLDDRLSDLGDESDERDAFWNAKATYDAADRAGETPDYDECPGGDCGCKRLVRDLFPDDPSQTDAAEQDATLRARPHQERIDDLVTRADAATERLDAHMRRIDDLERWRGGVDRQVKTLTDTLVADREHYAKKTVEAEQRLAALGAARTPGAEVTDAILDAFFDVYDASGAKTRREATRDALAAAMKAGGAK